MTCAMLVVGSDNPVDRILCREFYDGLLSGVARCRCCQRWVAFAVNDWDPDAGVDARLFVLWQIDAAVSVALWAQRDPRKTFDDLSDAEVAMLRDQIAGGEPFAGIVASAYLKQILAVVDVAKAAAGAQPWPLTLGAPGLLDTFEFKRLPWQ